jgi:hypothetical protein
VSILSHRIRSTDEIGWLEDGRIGVVLPHTMPDGAWKFVANARLAYDGSLPSPDCLVYAYPSRWIPGANGGPAHKPPQTRESLLRRKATRPGSCPQASRLRTAYGPSRNWIRNSCAGSPSGSGPSTSWERSWRLSS